MDEKDQKFEFVRFTWCDTMGIARGKTIPAKSFPRIKETGIGICSLTSVFSADSKPSNFPKLADLGFPDCFAVPYMETWHLCPWSGSEADAVVAQVLVQLHEKDQRLTPCGYDSRHVCSKLLAGLRKDFGMELLSALEYEFAVSKDEEPVTKGTHIYSPVALKKVETFCFEVSRRLDKVGVFIETIEHEFGEGQFELTMQPTKGIKAADNAFLYKQCVKETAIERGMSATFMCNPWGTVQSGGHFNFSLWENGENRFSDDSDPDGLSAVAKSWIAGMLLHAPAIIALVCHTNNCYNRFYEGGFAPFNICYAHEHRGSMLRVKKSRSSGVFLEFRCSGAAANPYLVLSAVVAAGMDGLRNKLQPPPLGFNEEKRIPTCLKDALDALEEDTVIKEALGEGFVEVYLTLKKQHDLPVVDLESQKAMYNLLI